MIVLTVYSNYFYFLTFFTNNPVVFMHFTGYRYPEDLELAEEMNALGLPISFSTTKQASVSC